VAGARRDAPEAGGVEFGTGQKARLGVQHATQGLKGGFPRGDVDLAGARAEPEPDRFLAPPRSRRERFLAAADRPKSVRRHLQHPRELERGGRLGAELMQVAKPRLLRVVPRLRRLERSEERRVGKECRSRWSPY